MYKLVLAYSKRPPRRSRIRSQPHENGTTFTVVRECDGAEFTIAEFAAAIGLHPATLTPPEMDLWEYGEYGERFRNLVRIKLDRKAGRLDTNGGNYEDPRPEEQWFSDAGAAEPGAAHTAGDN